MTTNTFVINLFLATGLSKKEFAEKLHVNPQTVSKWLNQKSEPQFVNIKVMRSVFRNYATEVDRKLNKQ